MDALTDQGASHESQHAQFENLQTRVEDLEKVVATLQAENSRKITHGISAELHNTIETVCIYLLAAVSIVASVQASKAFGPSAFFFGFLAFLIPFQMIQDEKKKAAREIALDGTYPADAA